jgi:uncharacterized protein (TIGR00251 family)
MLEAHAEGVLLHLQIQPKSSRNQVVGEHDGRLKIQITAPPVDGKANKALLAFLAKQLRLAKSNLRLLRGESSRKKTILACGCSLEDVRSRLGL